MRDISHIAYFHRYRDALMDDANCGKKELTKGMPASPGKVSGEVTFNHKDAKGKIFVKTQTTPDDVPTMKIVGGIVTSKGGITSHAAVVSRAMNIPCVVGCKDIQVKKEYFRCKDVVVHAGDIISIDGSTGQIFLEKKGV